MDGAVRTFIYDADVDSVVIDVSEGEHHEMFGYVSDVATDGLETLYIMDSEFKEVRAYDFSGSFLGSFGGPGEGPGEFRYSEEIAVSDQTVFVIDGPRVHVFGRGESKFVVKNTFKVDGVGFAGHCAMNGHLYHVGYIPDAEHVIHKLTTDGAHVHL